jgi:hypothetical protein
MALEISRKVGRWSEKGGDMSLLMLETTLKLRFWNFFMNLGLFFSYEPNGCHWGWIKRE